MQSFRITDNQSPECRWKDKIPSNYNASFTKIGFAFDIANGLPVQKNYRLFIYPRLLAHTEAKAGYLLHILYTIWELLQRAVETMTPLQCTPASLCFSTLFHLTSLSLHCYCVQLHGRFTVPVCVWYSSRSVREKVLPSNVLLWKNGPKTLLPHWPPPIM